MKLKISICSTILCLFLIGCKTDKKSDKKDISEFTYMEIYHKLFNDKTGGFDAHGDLYGQGAKKSISIHKEAGKCGDNLFVFNNSNKAIQFAIEATFNFPGNSIKRIVRAYKIKPADKLPVGATILCHNNKEYIIKREIISAGFITK